MKTTFVTINPNGFTVMPDPRLYYSVACSGLKLSDDCFVNHSSFDSILHDYSDTIIVVSSMDNYMDAGKPINRESHE